MDRHRSLRHVGGAFTDLTGIGQREIRLKAIFSQLIEPASDFRPLDLNCPANEFFGVGIVLRALGRLDELSGIRHGKRKIAFKALFRQQSCGLMEDPGEQPILFTPLDAGAGKGIAVVFLPKSQPGRIDVQGSGDVAKSGEAWFGFASLIFPNLLLALPDPIAKN